MFNFDIIFNAICAVASLAFGYFSAIENESENLYIRKAISFVDFPENEIIDKKAANFRFRRSPKRKMRNSIFFSLNSKANFRKSLLKRSKTLNCVFKGEKPIFQRKFRKPIISKAKTNCFELEISESFLDKSLFYERILKNASKLAQIEAMRPKISAIEKPISQIADSPFARSTPLFPFVSFQPNAFPFQSTLLPTQTIPISALPTTAAPPSTTALPNGLFESGPPAESASPERAFRPRRAVHCLPSGVDEAERLSRSLREKIMSSEQIPNSTSINSNAFEQQKRL